MTRREKFGTLVLLGERHAGPLGAEHLAARLGPSGLDRLVSVTRYAPVVSGHAEAVRLLADEARRAAQLHDPGLLRLLGVGRVGTTFYVSHEHVEGRTLAAIIERCRTERFPFAVDNALLVASRTAATLDFLQGRREDSGNALHHGLLVPRHVLVTYSGEVKLTGLGVWAALRETGLIATADRAYLAPEQKRGEKGDSRSDVYALGLLIYEMLTLEQPGAADLATSVGDATILGASGEREPMPGAVADILRSALAPDPAGRYQGPVEMRAAIDSLLFSGELSSTTFNLAFFMHTLFRQEIEDEARMLEEARSADYSEYLAPAAEASPAAGPAEATPEAASPAATQPAETEPGPTPGSDLTPTADALPVTAPLGGSTVVTGLETEVAQGSDSGRHRHPSPGDSSARRRAVRPERPADASTSARPRARRARGPAAPSFGRDAPTGGRRGVLLLGALVAALVVGGIVGYARFVGRPGAAAGPPTTTLTPEAQAALARVRQLEARIAELEAEQAAAQEKEASPEPVPATPSPRAAAAVAPPAPTAAPAEEERLARERAREEAQRRAEAERVRREEELRLLEQQKREAEARLVLEQNRTAAAANGSAALPTVAPPPPTPAPTVAPPPARGTLVDLADPDVVPPVLVRDARVDYPPAAERARKEATVVIDVLIDENGRVADARVVEPAALQLGFEAAALRMVRRRHYRPATQRGVPVKVHLTVRVAFTLAQ